MGGPFHQIAGFPNAHGVSVSAPNQSPALSQYMASLQQQQQQANAFSTNGFAAAGVGAGGVGAGGFSGTGTTAGTGFANQNARMSFAHAPNMAHQQQHVQSQHDFVSDHAGLRHAATGQQQRRIRDVWAHTLQEEMALVRDMVKLYPYVAMVSRPYCPIIYVPSRRFLSDKGLLRRIPSFPALCVGQWANSEASRTTITNCSGQTSISSISSKSGSRSLTRMATPRLYSPHKPTCSY